MYLLTLSLHDSLPICRALDYGILVRLERRAVHHSGIGHGLRLAAYLLEFLGHRSDLRDKGCFVGQGDLVRIAGMASRRGTHGGRRESPRADCSEVVSNAA